MKNGDVLKINQNSMARYYALSKTNLASILSSCRKFKFPEKGCKMVCKEISN